MTDTLKQYRDAMLKPGGVTISKLHDKWVIESTQLSFLRLGCDGEPTLHPALSAQFPDPASASAFYVQCVGRQSGSSKKYFAH